MDSLAPEAPATMGHNMPPATLADELAAAHRDELALWAELKKSYDAAPDRIENDDVQTRAAELIKKTRALEIVLEKAEDTVKRPYQDKVVAIRGFFKTTIEPMAKAREALGKKSAEYLQRKADAEKKRLAEEEDRRREAAALALKLAQDADAARSNMAAAAQDAARLAQEATDAKAAATSEQETAAAGLAQAKADHARARAEMLAFAAHVAEMAKAGTPVSNDERQQRKAAFEAALAGTRAGVDEAEAVLKQAREKAIEAKREADRLAQLQADRERETRAASREVASNLKEAVREEKAADKIAVKIAGPEADLARTRSIHGAVSTLARQWKCDVLNRDLLDKAALWPFINGEAIQAALWKWMMAQSEENRAMPGARIEQETVGQVR